MRGRMRAMLVAAWLSMLLLLFGDSVRAVKRHDFKTCAQSGFCRRLRDLPTSSDASPYSIDASSIVYDQDSGWLRAGISTSLYPVIGFTLELGVTRQGSARIKIDENNGLRQRYNETSRWALVEEPAMSTTGTRFVRDKGGKSATLSWSIPPSSSMTGSAASAAAAAAVKLTLSPFKLEFIRDGEVQVSFNEQNLFHMEHFRVKSIGQSDGNAEANAAVPDVDEATQKARKQFEPFMSEDGGWEEDFGGKTDSKPKGPESLSFDITFPGYQHVFGIPQHASPLSLRTTRGGDGAFTDPYRLFNLDTFEYLADSEMGIYGSIPFMHAHKPGSTVAVFAVIGSETWVDITKSPKSTHAHWMAESGILDLIVFLGPKSEQVFEDYGQLTGTTSLPQMFAIGHHQCRWNYLNQEDVLQVSSKFDEHEIPMDVIWLDIEYAKDHEYFVWDRANFPEPEKMQDGLAAVGRQLVAIVDPHIKRDPDLYVYKEAQELDILSKQPDGKTEYEGWCWTGSSSWTDYFNPASWDWWIGLFKFEKFAGSRRNLFIWNDMNEPAIFNGPEITMPRDNVHYGGWEHRDLHNINGMVYHNLTAQALIAREDPPRRPFVLSRSFFAGSQRYGAIWTGDNMGTWEHLAVAAPMILANSIAGMTFNGADVGGFFGNPEPEMLVRWYQNGAFHPFFRAHAHIDTKRREPYLFDEPVRSYIVDMIRLRYSLLPAWYTAFFHASLSGTPIIRPHFVMFSEDTAGFAVDDQYFVGTSGLLTHPVVQQGATEASVYLADDEPYYDYFDQSVYTRPSATASRSRVTVPAPLSKHPLFHRGGSILTRRDLVRRAAPLMWRDPITLVVAVDRTGTRASGDIYLDDGDSFNFEKGDLVWRGFELRQSDSKTLVLASHDLVKSYKGSNARFAAVAASYDPQNAFAKSIEPVNVEDIVVVGLASKPTCVKVKGVDRPVAFDWEDGVAHNAGSRKNGQKASVLRIRQASLPITRDWQISISSDKSASCSAPRPLTTQESLEDPTCPLPRQARCKNQGHIPACILISRINDGICDPECCDGSDETDGKVHCPNRCAEVNKAYRAKVDEEARIQRVGAKIRRDWSAAGLKEKRKIEKSIKKIEEELVELEQKQQQLRIALDRVEKSEASDLERKRSSRLFKRVSEHQAAIQSLRKHRSHLQTQVDELSNLLADLKKSFNPNYQDMAVLGSVRAFDDWRRKHGYEITDGPAVGTDAAAAAGSDAGGEPSVDGQEDASIEIEFEELSDDSLIQFEEDDILDLMSDLDSAGPAQDAANLLFRVEEYLPDPLKTHYETLRSGLLRLLTRVGILSEAIVEKSERPDVSKARTAYNQAESATNAARNKLKDEQDALNKDWGQGWEWKKLEGQCIEKDTGEYTYELCWFGKATQRSSRGHGNTNLGKFKSWHPEAASGTPESYTRQVYGDGQRCWNGPDRSVVVDIECGTSNALLSVMEPEKCTYNFKVQSPAVCQEPQSQAAAEDQGKPEL